MEIIIRLLVIVLFSFGIISFTLEVESAGYVTIAFGTLLFLLPLFNKKNKEDIYYKKSFAMKMDFLALMLMAPFFLELVFMVDFIVWFILASPIGFFGMYLYLQNSIYATFRMTPTAQGLEYEVNGKKYNYTYNQIDSFAIAIRQFPLWLSVLSFLVNVAGNSSNIAYNYFNDATTQAIKVLLKDSSSFFFTASINGKTYILNNFDKIIAVFKHKGIKIENYTVKENYRVTERPFFPHNKSKAVVLALLCIFSFVFIQLVALLMMKFVSIVLGENLQHHL